jgi:membrane protease YdiL (CAAX protease family)
MNNTASAERTFSGGRMTASPRNTRFWLILFLAIFIFSIPYRYFVLSWLEPMLSHIAKAEFKYGPYYVLIFGRITAQLYCLAVTMWLMKLLNIKKEDIGFHKISGLFGKESFYALLAGIAWWFSLEMFLNAADYLPSALGAVPHFSIEWQDMALFPASYRALKFIVLAPIVEELFFRGVVLTYLSRERGGRESLLLSSFIFAVYHYEIGDIWKTSFLWSSSRTLGDFVPLFASGLIYGFLYKKYKSIWPPFAAHLGYNLLASNLHISMWPFGPNP